VSGELRGALFSALAAIGLAARRRLRS